MSDDGVTRQLVPRLHFNIFDVVTLFQTFANPEDLPSKKMQVKMNDPNVERVRRAHLNDLENVIPFLLVSFLYVLTNPAAGLATMLIRVAALARFAHSFVYAVVVIPQPARAIAFAIPYFICFYMGVVSMGHFFYI